MPRKFLIILIFSIVLLSGCTSGQVPVAGTGVVFESFEADFTDVFIEEPVTLTAKIRNTATRTTGQGTITIIGLDIPQLPQPCEINNLQGPDPVYGTEGETRICSFALTFPQGTVGEGLSTTFYPIARLYYYTETEIVKSLTLANQAELRAIENRGGTLPLETVTSTGGPIALNVKSTGPIRVFSDTSSVTIPIEIEITNVGGGTPLLFGGGPEDYNKINFEFHDGLSAGLSIDEDCYWQNIVLFRGQSATVVCRLTINDISQIVAPTQKHFSVVANYEYFIDRSIPLNIHYRDTG